MKSETTTTTGYDAWTVRNMLYTRFQRLIDKIIAQGKQNALVDNVCSLVKSIAVWFG